MFGHANSQSNLELLVLLHTTLENSVIHTHQRAARQICLCEVLFCCVRNIAPPSVYCSPEYESAQGFVWYKRNLR